jgi:uncharacterized membrane protein
MAIAATNPAMGNAVQKDLAERKRADRKEDLTELLLDRVRVEGATVRGTILNVLAKVSTRTTLVLLSIQTTTKKKKKKKKKNSMKNSLTISLFLLIPILRVLSEMIWCRIRLF